MALKKIRVIATLFSALISIGCSSDGTFESPDSFEVTTPEAVHGQIGYRADIMVSKEGEEIARQVVLVVRDSDVSAAPIYVVMGYTSGAPRSTNQNAVAIVELIDALYTATSITLVPSLPRGIKQKGGITYGGSMFLCYLRVTAPSGTVYWSVRSSQEKIGEVLEYLAKPPKVIDTKPTDEEDTTPATVLEISYYSDQDLTIPLIDEVTVGDTMYIKVVFSKDVPIVMADDARARPSIGLSGVGRGPLQFRMKPPSTADEHLQNGDAKPYQGSKNAFVCKYVVSMGGLDNGIKAYSKDLFMLGDPILVKFYVHTADDAPENTGDTITDWHPSDFVGQVYTPIPEDGGLRYSALPIAGVTVTIAAGPRTGESTVTDKNGRYRFANIEADELHLLAERRFFEPKEVIAHRSRSTALPNGDTIDYPGDPQQSPGNILIGQAWPDEVRFILEETLVPPDLLFILSHPYIRGVVGIYLRDGIVGIFSSSDNPIGGSSLATTAHEIAHAHQHALVMGIPGARHNWVEDWVDSPEGKAFARAKERDWAEVGKTAYDSMPHFNSLWENAAETSANYWGRDTVWGGESQEETAPNRFRWAEEWLKKK